MRDWVLHLCAVSKVLPYFLCAGHYHYTRYGTYYLSDMGTLLPLTEENFTTIHSCGMWNVIGSDVTIESTLIKYGKSLGGLISITLQQRSVKKWAYSLHVSTQLLHGFDKMRDEEHRKVTVLKEEKLGRIKADKLEKVATEKVVINSELNLIAGIDPKKL